MPARMIVMLGLAAVMAAPAQETNSGFAVPVTLSGGAMYTDTLRGEQNDRSPAFGGFRAMIYPTVRVSKNVFGYAALQVRSVPYFYYDAWRDTREVQTKLIQGYAGYAASFHGTSLIVKGGKMVSAFGAFPLRYDDNDNPLLDQPMGYRNRWRLRADQLACGVSDLLHQGEYYYSVEHYCGGSTRERAGLAPVTLYGLWAAQLELSSGGADARFQLTNSSPANAQGLGSGSQHAQWTAGGGYTFAHQLRTGFSIYRGPYMDLVLERVLPSGETARDYPATGIGIDVQWAHGRWNLSGEWQQFRFPSPRFTHAPNGSNLYLEAKLIVTPRVYLAARAGGQQYGRIADVAGLSASSFAPTQQAYEFAAGVRVNRRQLLKFGYEWNRTDGVSGTRDNVLGVQFVTTIRSVSKAFGN